MIAPTIKATYNSQPLDVLNKLIEKRQKWLNESAKDSVVATAITALRSIRAATTTHFGKKKISLPSTDIVITRKTDVHPSFSGKKHKRCFRAGSTISRNAPTVDLGKHCVQLVPPSSSLWKSAQVWSVKLSNERHERWSKQPIQFYVVATSFDAVLSYLQKRFGRIADRQAGLARTVLSKIMMKLSTHPPAQDKTGVHAQAAANKYTVVNQTDTGDSIVVHVESNLMYAVSAVKGGIAGIQNALKSAANKVFGVIKHKVGSSLTNELTTPFPEVKRRR